MSQTLFDSHKFVFPKQIQKLALLVAISVPSLWIVALNDVKPIAANPPGQTMAATGEPLPVPSVPIPSRKQQATQAVPPPPVDISFPGANPSIPGLTLSAAPNNSFMPGSTATAGLYGGAMMPIGGNMMAQATVQPNFTPLPPMIGGTATPVAQANIPFSNPVANPGVNPYLAQTPMMVVPANMPMGQQNMPGMVQGIPVQVPGSPYMLIVVPMPTAPGMQLQPMQQNIPAPNPAVNPSYLAPLPPPVSAPANPQGQMGIPGQAPPANPYMAPAPPMMSTGVNPQAQSYMPLPTGVVNPVTPSLPMVAATPYSNGQPNAMPWGIGGEGALPNPTSTATGFIPQPLPIPGAVPPTQEFVAPPDPAQVPTLPQTAPQTTQTPASPQDRGRRLLRSTAQSEPSLTLQGAYVTQGGESSGRARISGEYPLTPQLLIGGTFDLTSQGSRFDGGGNTGANINELYLATAFPGVPSLRFVIGQMDLTSYFDRNSFAKDGTSQFFNAAFQTNPALAAAGISSRPGFLVNWSVTDNIEAKAAVFSSGERSSNFALDGLAGEVAVRYGNAIFRGTYASSRDAENNDSFPDIFGVVRDEKTGETGLRENDREEAYGVNFEYYVPSMKLGLFGRYGKYRNRDVGGANGSADSYAFGASLLDIFSSNDRLGLAYGRSLSGDRQRFGRNPDVLELFYDFQFLPNVRFGLSVQGRDSFRESVLGVRVKTEFDVTPRGRLAR